MQFLQPLSSVPSDLLRKCPRFLKRNGGFYVLRKISIEKTHTPAKMPGRVWIQIFLDFQRSRKAELIMTKTEPAL